MLKFWSALSWLFTYCLTLVRHRVFLSKEKEKVFRVWKWQVYLFSSTGLWSCRAAVKFPFPRDHTPLSRMSSSRFHTSILSSRACLAHRKGFSVKAQVWTLARVFWSLRDGFLHRVCGFRSSSSSLKAQGGPQRPGASLPVVVSVSEAGVRQNCLYKSWCPQWPTQLPPKQWFRWCPARLQGWWSCF